MDRKGVLYEEAIFIILNLVFFAILLVFIYNSSQGRSVYEQVYAKQIALMIDEAKPGTIFSLNMEDALKIAKNNGVKNEDAVKIDEKAKKVFVRLGSGKGYGYTYFSDYKIKINFDKNNLILGVGK